MYKNFTIKEFSDKTSEKNPVPGGGAVSAIISALTASLGLMVSAYTLNNKKYENVSERTKNIKQELEKSREILFELAEKDSELFLKYQATDKNNNSLLSEVTRENIENSLHIADESLKILKMSYELYTWGNKFLRSDAYISCVYAWSGIKASVCLINENKKSVSEEIYLENINKITEKINSETDFIINKLPEVMLSNG
ncbi:MAG: cyclodeaminase/cyclohydrolase family protein [Thermotogae bacterium]|nr:cyclodeaminase/cyclohydrolase family protein [Thermotogota bacterium]MCP5465992.1 cyclodeaminase/cyclohydrolase family protein [Thermotogota bacterium]